MEYARSNPQGLVHQGWKDSHDAIFHADGSSAAGPIALCEVQGYVYAARRACRPPGRVLGAARRADELERQAAALRERFEAAFWCDDLDTYALALDGRKRPCRVRTSNAGQCLFTGVVSPERAGRVARTLLAPESFSGWGVRTVASSEARYNPMSYHNGSVWPHDNALIAWGLDRYGLKDGAAEIAGGLLGASPFLDLHRMPELFCGFSRRPGEGPTLYPVACAPQAWSAAAVFLLVQSCLGLTANALERQVCFREPRLPPGVRELHIEGLHFGEASVDLLAQPRRRRGSQRPAARGGPARVGGEVSPYDLFGGVRATRGPGRSVTHDALGRLIFRGGLVIGGARRPVSFRRPGPLRRSFGRRGRRRTGGEHLERLAAVGGAKFQVQLPGARYVVHLRQDLVPPLS